MGYKFIAFGIATLVLGTISLSSYQIGLKNGKRLASEGARLAESALDLAIEQKRTLSICEALLSASESRSKASNEQRP